MKTATGTEPEVGSPSECRGRQLQIRETLADEQPEESMQAEKCSERILSLTWQAADDWQIEGQDVLLVVLVGKLAKLTASLDHSIQEELNCLELHYPENFYISI